MGLKLTSWTASPECTTSWRGRESEDVFVLFSYCVSASAQCFVCFLHLQTHFSNGVSVCVSVCVCARVCLTLCFGAICCTLENKLLEINRVYLHTIMERRLYAEVFLTLTHTHTHTHSELYRGRIKDPLFLSCWQGGLQSFIMIQTSFNTAGEN